jgi:hypothetical protein
MYVSLVNVVAFFPQKLSAPSALRVIPAPPAGGLQETPRPAPQRPRKPSHYKMRSVHEKQLDKPLFRQLYQRFQLLFNKGLLFRVVSFRRRKSSL